LAYPEGPSFRDEDVDTWDRYVGSLKSSFVRIKDKEDTLVWSLNPIRDYAPREGYRALVA
jgi:hypothetical protein